MSEQIPLPRFSVSVSDFVVSIIGLLQSGVSFDIIILGLKGCQVLYNFSVSERMIRVFSASWAES